MSYSCDWQVSMRWRETDQLSTFLCLTWFAVQDGSPPLSNHNAPFDSCQNDTAASLSSFHCQYSYCRFTGVQCDCGVCVDYSVRLENRPSTPNEYEAVWRLAPPPNCELIMWHDAMAAAAKEWRAWRQMSVRVVRKRLGVCVWSNEPQTAHIIRVLNLSPGYDITATAAGYTGFTAETHESNWTRLFAQSLI